MDEDWFHSYRVELILNTDVDIECLKDLKWWEDYTHTDESPYFLITNIIAVEKK